MQNVLALAPAIAKTSSFGSAAGQGRSGLIDARDVAAVAAEIAAAPDGHAGQTYWLTGPELTSNYDVAAVLSELLGRTITYRELTFEENKDAMICAGIPAQIAEMNAQAFSLTADGDAEWVTGDVASLLGRPARSFEQFAADSKQVAWLAVECFAERGERREAHRPGAAVLEDGQVGGRDPDAVREFAHGHLPPDQHDVDVDGDRHQITSSSSACSCAAWVSRATAWASSIRSTSTMSATPRMATPAPAMMRVTPGSSRWPGAFRAVTANHTRAAATIAPMMTSTYRKAARRTRFLVAPS